MKKNPKWIELQNKIAEKQQAKLDEKHKDLPPIKMSREEKRRYIRHYKKMGVPQEEIERIILMRDMQSMASNNSNKIDLGEISKKVANGELPENTLDIINNFQEGSN